MVPEAHAAADAALQPAVTAAPPPPPPPPPPSPPPQLPLAHRRAFSLAGAAAAATVAAAAVAAAAAAADAVQPFDAAAVQPFCRQSSEFRSVTPAPLAGTATVVAEAEAAAEALTQPAVAALAAAAIAHALAAAEIGVASAAVQALLPHLFLGHLPVRTAFDCQKVNSYHSRGASSSPTSCASPGETRWGRIQKLACAEVRPPPPPPSLVPRVHPFFFCASA